MNVCRNCTDVSDIVPLCPSQGLFLKPIARINVSVQLPQLKPQDKAISSWEVMEKLRKMVKPEKFSNLKVTKSTLDIIRFEGEVEAKAFVPGLIVKLDMKTIKLSGFSDALKVRAGEAKICFPTRHMWDSYFREAKHMNEMKPGERPDTLHITNLPCKWFTLPEYKDREEKPSEYIFRKVFETFGEVRYVDVPCTDPYRSRMKSKVTGMKTFSFDEGNYFEGYIQYKEYMGFLKAMTALKGMQLLFKDKDKAWTASIKVDYDRSKHMTDHAIRRRHVERENLLHQDAQLLDKERRQREAEEAKKDEMMKKELQLKEMEEQKKDAEKKCDKKKHKEKSLEETEKAHKKVSKKLAREERKLREAQQKLESIHLLDMLFEGVKVSHTTSQKPKPMSDLLSYATQVKKLLKKQQLAKKVKKKKKKKLSKEDLLKQKQDEEEKDLLLNRELELRQRLLIKYKDALDKQIEEEEIAEANKAKEDSCAQEKTEDKFDCVVKVEVGSPEPQATTVSQSYIEDPQPSSSNLVLSDKESSPGIVISASEESVDSEESSSSEVSISDESDSQTSDSSELEKEKEKKRKKAKKSKKKKKKHKSKSESTGSKKSKSKKEYESTSEKDAPPETNNEPEEAGPPPPWAKANWRGSWRGRFPRGRGGRGRPWIDNQGNYFPHFGFCPPWPYPAGGGSFFPPPHGFRRPNFARRPYFRHPAQPMPGYYEDLNEVYQKYFLKFTRKEGENRKSEDEYSDDDSRHHHHRRHSRDSRSESRDRRHSRDSYRSRSYSRDRSRRRSRSRESRSWSREKYRSRTRSRERERSRSRSKTRERSRSRSRRRNRSRSRSKENSRSRSRSRERDRSRSRGRERSRSRSRERPRSRNRGRERSKSRSREGKRSRSRSVGGEKSKSERRSRERQRSRSQHE